MNKWPCIYIYSVVRTVPTGRVSCSARVFGGSAGEESTRVLCKVGGPAGPRATHNHLLHY